MDVWHEPSIPPPRLDLDFGRQVEFAISIKGIGLEEPRISGQMGLRMLAFAVARDAIMPDRLDERSTAAPKNEDIPGEWIPSEPLLHLQSEATHTAAHISVTRCDPNSNTCRNGDHSRNAANTRRRAPRLTSLPTRTCRPLPSSISISPDAGVDRVDGAGRGAASDGMVARGAAIICTGMNIDMSGDAVSTPSRTCRRQVNRRLSQTSWRAATARIAAPGSCVSATMRNLSAVLQRRRPSRPVMISATHPSIHLKCHLK